MSRGYLIAAMLYAAGAIAMYCMQIALEQIQTGNQAFGAIIIVATATSGYRITEKVAKYIRV